MLIVKQHKRETPGSQSAVALISSNAKVSGNNSEAAVRVSPEHSCSETKAKCFPAVGCIHVALDNSDLLS